MTQRMLMTALVVVGLVALADVQISAQAPPAAAASAGGTATAPTSKTPWGDPDLQGVYANDNEYATPLERPQEFAGRTLADITPAELKRLNEERNQQRVEADKQRWELRSPLQWTFAMNLTRTGERAFEYACHEGNYAMRNILSAARTEDKK